MTVYRAEIRGVIAGQGFINVLHFRSANGTSSQVAQLAALVGSNWVDYVRGEQFAQAEYKQVKVKTLDQPSWPEIELPVILNGTAASTANYSPVMCIVLKKKSSVAGRHGRGRVYLAGCGGSDMVHGNWANQRFNRLIDLCAAMTQFWCAPSNTLPFWMVLHNYNGPPQDSINVEVIQPRLMIGFQRRRNLGVGY